MGRGIDRRISTAYQHKPEVCGDAWQAGDGCAQGESNGMGYKGRAGRDRHGIGSVGRAQGLGGDVAQEYPG